MRIPGRYIPFLLLLSIQCGGPPAQQSDQLVDSARAVTGPLQPPSTSEAVTSSPRPGNFPGFADQTFTDDARELAVVEPLMKMLNIYDTGQYFTVKLSYKRSFKEDMPPDVTMDATETETKTWYYDSAKQLRAYTRDYDYRVGNAGYSTTSSIYIVSADSIVAMYDDMHEAVQIDVQRKKRLLSAKCPQCGVTVSSEMTGNFTLEDISNDELTQLTKSFRDEREWMIARINASMPKKTMEGDRVVIQTDITTGTTEQNMKSFPVEFSIDPRLLHKIFTVD